LALEPHGSDERRECPITRRAVAPLSEAHAFVSIVSLATHSSTATVGTPAPSFALPNASGERIGLDDLVAGGPVVLVFLRGFA
jgi:AhpC/TSA family